MGVTTGRDAPCPASEFAAKILTGGLLARAKRKQSASKAQAKRKQSASKAQAKRKQSKRNPNPALATHSRHTPDMAQVPLDMLTCKQLQRMLQEKTGTVWARAKTAIADNDVCGTHLAPHVESANSLGRFFAEKLGCSLTPFVAEQLLGLIKTGRPSVDAPASPVAAATAGTETAGTATAGTAEYDGLDGSGVGALAKFLQRVRGNRSSGGNGSGSGHDSSDTESSSSSDDDDDDDDDHPGNFAKVVWRCTDLTTGESHLQTFSCPSEKRDNPETVETFRAQAARVAAARFHGHAAQVTQVRAGMCRLRWACVATNTRTGARKDIVVASVDDDALSEDPAARARFERSVAFDFAESKKWDLADTHVRVGELQGLSTPKKYSFVGIHRVTGATNAFQIKTMSADYEFNGAPAKQAAMARLTAQYAAQEGWAAEDTQLYAGKPTFVVNKVRNSATGETVRVLNRSVVPHDLAPDEVAAFRERMCRTVAQKVAESKGWPADSTRAEVVDAPRNTKKLTHRYVAHNRLTDEKVQLSVTTRDGRARFGTDEQKVEFWREVADECVCVFARVFLFLWIVLAFDAQPMALLCGFTVTRGYSSCTTQDGVRARLGQRLHNCDALGLFRLLLHQLTCLGDLPWRLALANETRKKQGSSQKLCARCGQVESGPC